MSIMDRCQYLIAPSFRLQTDTQTLSWLLPIKYKTVDKQVTHCEHVQVTVVNEPTVKYSEDQLK